MCLNISAIVQLIIVFYRSYLEQPELYVLPAGMYSLHIVCAPSEIPGSPEGIKASPELSQHDVFDKIMAKHSFHNYCKTNSRAIFHLKGWLLSSEKLFMWAFLPETGL